MESLAHQPQRLYFNNKLVTISQQLSSKQSIQKLFPTSQEEYIPFQVLQKYAQGNEDPSHHKFLSTFQNIYFDNQLYTIQNLLEFESDSVLNCNNNDIENKYNTELSTTISQQQNITNNNNQQSSKQYSGQPFIIKITPFQKESQCEFQGLGLNISKNIEQFQQGFIMSTKIQCDQIQVIVGIEIQIQEQPKLQLNKEKQQTQMEIEKLIEEDSDTLEKNNEEVSSDLINQDHQESTYVMPIVENNNNVSQNPQQSLLEEIKQHLPQQNKASTQKPHMRKHSIDSEGDFSTAEHIIEEDYCPFKIDSLSKKIQKKRKASTQKQTRRKKSSFFKSDEKDETSDPDYQIPTNQPVKINQNQKKKQGEKGDKKNVVKNFIKSFRSWINQNSYEQHPDNNEIVMKLYNISTQQELVKLREDWKAYEFSHKYNNTLIKSLLNEGQYQALFHYFVNNIANIWLKNSSVHDKEAHAEVLKGYIKATQNLSELDSIVILKSRN